MVPYYHVQLSHSRVCSIPTCELLCTIVYSFSIIMIILIKTPATDSTGTLSVCFEKVHNRFQSPPGKATALLLLIRTGQMSHVRHRCCCCCCCCYHTINISACNTHNTTLVSVLINSTSSSFACISKLIII